VSFGKAVWVRPGEVCFRSGGSGELR
jgi:hypothetical protein